MALINSNLLNDLVDGFINNKPLTNEQLTLLSTNVMEYLKMNNIQIDITNEYILDNINKEPYKFIDNKINTDEEFKEHLKTLFKNLPYEYIFKYIFKKNLNVLTKEITTIPTELSEWIKSIYTIFFNNYKENYIKYKKHNNLIVNKRINRKLFILSNGQSTSDFLDKSFLDKNYYAESDDIINLFIDYYVNNYDIYLTMNSNPFIFKNVN